MVLAELRGGEFGVHYSHSKKLFYGRRILTLWNQRTPFMGYVVAVEDLRVFQFRPFIPLTSGSSSYHPCGQGTGDFRRDKRPS